MRSVNKVRESKTVIGLMLIAVLIACYVFSIPFQSKQNVSAAAVIGQEILSCGDFEGIVTDDPVPLLGTKNESGFQGFGLYQEAPAKSGEWFKEDGGNTALKFGADYKGFTGNDYVLDMRETPLTGMGKGVFSISFDIKPVGVILEKTWYLRVQGGPAGGFYENYLIPFESKTPEADWAELKEGSKMTALDNDWYRYTLEIEVNSTPDGMTLWLMAGITGASGDDYYLLDNFSVKKIFNLLDADADEIFRHGSFEQMIRADETSFALDGTPRNNIVGFGPSGLFERDENENTYLKLGMSYAGAVTNENGSNIALQMNGLNFNQWGGFGEFTLTFDIKANGDVVEKTAYIRTMLQGGDKNMVYINDYADWSDAKWSDTSGEVFAWMDAIQGKTGWYKFTQKIKVAEWFDNNISCNSVWIMAGIFDGTDDDYYAIDNFSFKRTGSIPEQGIADDSVPIDPDDQVELITEFDKLVDPGEDEWVPNETDGWSKYGFGSYGNMGAGKVVKEGDKSVLHMGYSENGTLISEPIWGYNLSFFFLNDFKETGAGHYSYSFDVKPYGDMVKNTAYFRTMLNPGDKSMQYFVSPGSEDPTQEWQWVVDKMTDLGNGWYRFSRNIVISQAAGNIDCDRILIMMGYDIEAVEAGGDLDTDYYAIKNMSLIKTRELVENVPELISSPDQSFDYKDAKDVALEVNLKGNEIQLLKGALRGKTQTTIQPTNYSWDAEGQKLIVKKGYLSTLKDGDYDFTIATLGGDVVFTITVKNAPTDSQEGCKSYVAAISGMITLFAAAFVVIKRR